MRFLLPDYCIFILRFILFAAIHSACASLRIKRLAGAGAGQEPRFYRLAYNIMSSCMLIWVMSAYRNSPVLYYVPGIWSLLMYLMQLVIAALLVDCIRRTGAAEFFGIRQFENFARSKKGLVTNGWYSVVRHPLYLLSILFLLLNPVMTGQWLLLTLLSTVYFTVGAWIEEGRLLREFGQEYAQYRNTVPCMIPDLNRSSRSKAF